MTDNENDIDLGSTVPSDPDVRKKIRNAVFEIAGQLQMIADAREHINDCTDVLKKLHGVPPNIVKKLATAHFKQRFQEVDAQKQA